MTYTVAAFYKFVNLPDFTDKREPLLQFCQDKGIKGTILLAQEGINGTIAGLRADIDAVFAFLRSDQRLADLEIKESSAPEVPFGKMKVKLKREIVTMGVATVNPLAQVGSYVKPKDWNDLISDPEVVLIDTRNDYEVDIGTFKGAINPHIHSFRQFPDYIKENYNPETHKKVAMFCTGGIRCEKATSFLLEQGFQEVYHLQGGILKYLEEIPDSQSLWEGECFVFDERVAVKQGLELGSYEMCLACGYPISQEDMQSPDYEYGVSCPHCSEIAPKK